MNEVKKAADWLKFVRNEDNGWGNLPGIASSVITTSEATIGLIISGDDDTEFHLASLNYLSEAINDKKCYKTAQWSWATMALLSSCMYINFKEAVLTSINELIRTVNSDGGWGYDEKDHISKVYPTTLALRALTLAKRKIFNFREKLSLIDDTITRGIIWLISAQNYNDGGWGITKGEESSVGLTAHALITLSDHINQNYFQHIERGISWLLSKQKENGEFINSKESYEVWENKYEFVHFSTPWVIIALLKYGKVSDTKIKRAVSFLIELQDDEGGWKNTSTCSYPLIWATYNAIFALVTYKELFALYSKDEKNNQNPIGNNKNLITLSEKFNLISSRNFIYVLLYLVLFLCLIIIYLLIYLIGFAYLNTIAIVTITVLGAILSIIISKALDRKKIEALGIFIAVVSLIVTIWQLILALEPNT